jgi:hypothetical protein
MGTEWAIGRRTCDSPWRERADHRLVCQHFGCQGRRLRRLPSLPCRSRFVKAKLASVKMPPETAIAPTLRKCGRFPELFYAGIRRVPSALLHACHGWTGCMASSVGLHVPTCALGRPRRAWPLAHLKSDARPPEKSIAGLSPSAWSSSGWRLRAIR